MSVLNPPNDLVETPFLYETMLEQVLNAGPIWPRILIWGGPGLGKSRFVQELKWEAQNVSRLSVELLSGKKQETQGQLLLWAKNPTGLMVVDDFDRCWSKTLEAATKSLPEDNPDAWRIVVTVSNPEELDEEVDVASSHALTTFQRLRLDPWSDLDSVELALQDSLRSTLQKHIQPTKVPQTERLALNQIVDEWCAATLAVSEGHPLLIGGSFVEFLNLAKKFIELDPSTLELLTMEGPPRQDEMENHLAGALMDAPPTRRLFEAIRRFHKKQPEAFRHLVKLAEGSQLSAAKYPTIHQNLRNSGLAYVHPRSRRLVIASGIVRAKVLELAQKALPKSQPAISALSTVLSVNLELENDGDGRGFLRYTTTDGRSGQCRLRGKGYKILEILFAERGRVVPLAELKERLDDATEHSVRGAIQRLTRNLGKAHLAEVVLNQFGRGYYLGSEPYLKSDKGADL